MNDVEQRPLRVLQVVGAMNRAGAETWLMHVLRLADRRQLQMDFLTFTTEPGDYDAEIRELGGRIIPCLHPYRPWAFRRNFQRALQQGGPYDIIHSHIQHYSGFIFRLAWQAGIPVRIIHSHLDTSDVDAHAGVLRRVYLRAMTRWIWQYATLGLAVSHEAANALFPPNWDGDPRWRLLYCGIDLTAFHHLQDCRSVREELGIPADALVVGHVGRFFAQKNHDFLLDIAVQIARQQPNMRLLLIGDGPLRPAIERKVMSSGLANNVIFTGVRADIPRLLIGGIDVVVLPSLFEGLPLAGLEAQAAGVPLVLSDTITEELDVLSPIVRHVSLRQPAQVWAQEVLALCGQDPPITAMEALTAIEQSPFNIQVSVANLVRAYDEATGKRLASRLNE